MSIEMNWHEGDEHPGITWEGDAEPLPGVVKSGRIIATAPATAPRLPLPSRRVLVAVLGGLLVVAVAAFAVLAWRVNQGNALAQRDLDATVQEWVAARRDGDRPRLAALLDASDPVWAEATAAALTGADAPAVPQAVTVEKVWLDGQRAAAELVETGANGQTVRKIGFFRLNDGQWQVAAPWSEFFGAERSVESPHFHITYRRRDQPFVDTVINLAEGAYVSLCGELRCAPDLRPLDLQLIYAPDTPGPPFLYRVGVTSPSLLGLLADDRPSAAFHQEVVRQTAQALAAIKAPGSSMGLQQVIGDWAAVELAGGDGAGNAVLAEALQAGALLSLEQVWRAVALDEGVDPLARAQMGSVVAFVQEMWGADAVGRLLENSAESFAQMTQQSFGVAPDEFQARWLDWLTRDSAPVSETVTG